MKRLTVTLIGTVVRSATRTFVIEVPDEVSCSTLDRQVLEDLADEARIPWEFGTESFVEVTDHTVEEEAPPVQDCRFPVIPFKIPEDPPLQHFDSSIGSAS